MWAHFWTLCMFHWTICISLCPYHINVWQNPLQYCKVIRFQLIKINEKIKESAFLTSSQVKAYAICPRTTLWKLLPYSFLRDQWELGKWEKSENNLTEVLPKILQQLKFYLDTSKKVIELNYSKMPPSHLFAWMQGTN